jgi:hypothetical protein
VGRECCKCGEERNAYRVLVEKPDAKKEFLRTRRRWENNIKLDLTEIGLAEVDLIHLSLVRDT